MRCGDDEEDWFKRRNIWSRYSEVLAMSGKVKVLRCRMVALPPELWERLEEKSSESCHSVSDLISMAVEEWLKK